jgi:DNA-binding response OmpR family regulator
MCCIFLTIWRLHLIFPARRNKPLDSRKKKILIADDDLAILEVLTIFLEEMGYEVETTYDGHSLRTFEHGYPDVLLLDIWLSGVNGRDLCRYFKSQEKTRHLPILLISANRNMQRIACEAGADDFIAKPFDLDKLLDKIEGLL